MTRCAAILTFRDPEAPPALGFGHCATLTVDAGDGSTADRAAAVELYFGTSHPAYPWLRCVIVQFIYHETDGADAPLIVLSRP